MRRLNRILAAVAIAVLVVTASLLSWLRQRAESEVERSIANAHKIDANEVLHGPGNATLVHFRLLEQHIERLTQSPSYILNARVTKLVNGKEHPIVPFDWFARQGERWPEAVADWSRQPLLTAGDQPWGYIYLDVDRSLPRRITWTIVATGLAIALLLATLLARLWSQETNLTRTMVELNERKRELIRIERLALAGQLAAGLLHDLRKPVLNIQHSLDELSDALGDFAPAAASLQDLRRQTRLFFQILSDSQMERFVQSDRVGEEYLDMVQLIDYALNLVRYERRGVEIVRRENDVLPSVLAQPFRLIQLFSNLILNAYQAMGGRGRLTLDAAAEGSGVKISVIDSGPGIPAEVLPRIFDPFYTTKPVGEGTGLGLSICRMIVEDLGGRIWAENMRDGGAAFHVWLPAEPNRPADPA